MFLFLKSSTLRLQLSKAAVNMKITQTLYLSSNKLIDVRVEACHLYKTLGIHSEYAHVDTWAS